MSSDLLLFLKDMATHQRVMNADRKILSHALFLVGLTSFLNFGDFRIIAGEEVGRMLEFHRRKLCSNLEEQY